MKLEDKLKKFIIDLDEIAKPIDFQKLFGNNNPVHIEIGSGKGEFISKKAEAFPNINFIGIEIKKSRLVKITKKLNNELNNVFLCRLFVDHTIGRYIKNQDVDVIYIQHPDPWPKRRHFKNRIIQHPFIDALNFMLKKDGEVRIATDHPGYAEWIRKHFISREDFSPLHENGHTFEMPEDHIETYFEKTWREKGFPPHFLFFKKTKEIDPEIQKQLLYEKIIREFKIASKFKGFDSK